MSYHGSAVQYLRMPTNSLIGGALVGAYVAVLVLQLNPSLQLTSLAVAPLILTWWTFYGVHAAVFFYALIVLRQMLAVEVTSPGWISLRLLSAFGTLAMLLSAIVTWLNLRGFSSVLGPDAAGRMSDGAAVVSACAAVCVTVAILQRRLKRRRGVAAGVVAAVLVTSIVAPVVLRGWGAPTPSPRTTGSAGSIPPAPSDARVSMILLDGATLDFIAPNAAGGRFPNFGRLLENGAVLHLATLRPTQPAPVWTAVATEIALQTTVTRPLDTARPDQISGSTCCRISASRRRWRFD